MEKIQKKIIKKIYQIETKRTILEILFKIVIGLLLVTAVFVFGEIFFEILKEEKTLDFFQIFNEDFEVIKKYFFEVIYIFYLEIPKIILILFLITTSIFFYLIWQIIKNYNIIKNKVISLIKFWRKKI